jgi:hypothetical protein
LLYPQNLPKYRAEGSFLIIKLCQYTYIFRKDSRGLRVASGIMMNLFDVKTLEKERKRVKSE